MIDQDRKFSSEESDDFPLLMDDQLMATNGTSDTDSDISSSVFGSAAIGGGASAAASSSSVNSAASSSAVAMDPITPMDTIDDMPAIEDKSASAAVAAAPSAPKQDAPKKDFAADKADDKDSAKPKTAAKATSTMPAMQAPAAPVTPTTPADKANESKSAPAIVPASALGASAGGAATGNKPALHKNNSPAAKPAVKSKNGAKKRGNKKRIVWAIIVLALMMLVVVAFLVLQNLGVPVNTATAENNDVSITVFATGAIASGESHDVYPETQGLIQTVYVAEGDVVEEGDILATLDDTANQAQLSQAEAGLAQARAGLAQARSAGDQADAGVAAAQAGLDAANAAVSSAENAEASAINALNSARETVRAMQASGANVTNPAQFAQAQGAVTAAEVSLDQAEAAVAQAEAGVAQARAGLRQARAVETDSGLAAARASVEAAEDAVALAESAVEATVIRAPKDGMVLFAPTAASAAAMGTGITPTSGTELTQGSAVTPGAPLFTVVEEYSFSFVAEVDEVDVRAIEVGQIADITLSAYNGRSFRAVVSDISNLASPTMTGGTVFEVTLSFEEEIPGIRIGMRGDTTIEIETRHNALTIPLDAWSSSGGEDFAFLINDNNQLVRTPIIVGASTEMVVEVLEGLEEGDVVALTSGALVPLEDGMIVTP